MNLSEQWDHEMDVFYIFVLLTLAFLCNGVNIYEAKAILRKKQHAKDKIPKIMRRFSLNREPSVILGAPSYPYHLPAAEPILPGHTLVRPAVGMLKSSIKFPHREQENGSGVYGYFENLGIKYDGRNERVLYTGFRRSHPKEDLNTRRSMYNPSSYRGRHLEIYPAYKREIKDTRQSSLSKLSGPNKVLTIYPSKIMAGKIKKKITAALGATSSIERNNKEEQYYPTPSKRLKKASLRYFNYMNPEETVLGQVILVKRKKETDFVDLLRLIKSLRRDQEKKSKVLLYVPGKAKPGDFGIADSDPEGETSNKTAMFWKTKNAFNHVKISPDAPEHTELIPMTEENKQKNWWFYHQSDFEDGSLTPE